MSMRPLRTCLIFLVLAALPASSWASVFVACAQYKGSQQVQVSIVSDAHAHHASGEPDSLTVEENTVPGDCTCCGECASMCPASGCGLAGVTTHGDIGSFASDGRCKEHIALLYASPTPNPLFRPPIQIR